MKNEDFIKLKKSEKLMILPTDEYIKDADTALFIPIRKKVYDYNACAFFVRKDDEWYRLGDYDCFRFISRSVNMLRGDFENGGIQFFLKGKWDASSQGNFSQNE